MPVIDDPYHHLAVAVFVCAWQDLSRSPALELAAREWLRSEDAADLAELLDFEPEALARVAEMPGSRIPPGCVSTKETMQRLGISKDTLIALIQKGELTQVGRNQYKCFQVSEIERLKRQPRRDGR